MPIQSYRHGTRPQYQSSELLGRSLRLILGWCGGEEFGNGRNRFGRLVFNRLRLDFLLVARCELPGDRICEQRAWETADDGVVTGGLAGDDGVRQVSTH